MKLGSLSLFAERFDHSQLRAVDWLLDCFAAMLFAMLELARRYCTSFRADDTSQTSILIYVLGLSCLLWYNTVAMLLASSLVSKTTPFNA